MTNPELAPDMPEERSMEFTSDDDPNVRFRMMQDSQGDIWLAIITPQPEIMSSFRLCTRQGGGHRNNRNLWQAFAALLGPGPLAGLRRADLAPQAGSVDVEGLKREIRENMGAGYNNHYYMGADIAVDYLVERNLLNPGPQGWRDKAEQRLKDTQTWISENAPYIATDEKHLDENTEARAYWHYGYAIALKDLLNISSPPNKEMIAGAPVGGDQELIDALLEAQRKINAAQEHIDELEQKHVMKNDKMFARGLTNDAYNCISHVLIELRKGAESPRPAIPGLQEAQGWQTVENVPRDQDVLVGYLNHAGEVEDVSVAYVSEGEKYHINSIYAEPRGDCRHCGGACKRVYVTHWMPLPAAPRDGRD